MAQRTRRSRRPNSRYPSLQSTSFSTDACVVCERVVTERQHGLCCDICSRWQHRICNSGVSHVLYRRIVKNDIEDFHWKCSKCSTSSPQPPLTTISSPVGSSLAQEDLPQPVAHSTLTSPSFPATPQPGESFAREDSPPPCDEPEGQRHQQVQSFNISVSFADPRPTQPPARPAIIPTLPETFDVDQAEDIAYEVVTCASQRSGRVLVDSLGYKYTVKAGARKNGTLWRCCVRNKTLVCKATVDQCGDVFTRSLINHNHQAEPGIATKVKITKRAHQLARENVFRSAAAIVDEIFITDLHPEDPAPSRPNPANLVRSSNYHRQKDRPAEPQDLSFEVDENWLPEDFLQRDIVLEGARHLFFATPSQLRLLRSATSIFMDGTFKVVREPFYQLFSIHAFLGDDRMEEVKQVPIAFVMMSRRRKRDYKAIFQVVKDLVPDVTVLTITLDFETAIWRAAESVFPGVKIHGCSFHWSQALWRKVQELGLSPVYRYKRSGPRLHQASVCAAICSSRAHRTIPPAARR
ncbi:uncharacterized protein [Ptychodera flava]|uniref:uncharacterized protein n=1 Tax=Ptychodera flava TaxID=63121 RepID=UPI00396A4153